MKKLNWNSGWKVWQDKNAFNLVFAVPTDAKTVDLPCDAGFYLQQDPACLRRKYASGCACGRIISLCI